MLPHVSVDSPSGVYSRQWRTGEQTVRAGGRGAAGGGHIKRAGGCWRRCHRSGWCASTPSRMPAALDWQLGMDGKLRLPLGALDEGQLPAGQWVQLDGRGEGAGAALHRTGAVHAGDGLQRARAAQQRAVGDMGMTQRNWSWEAKQSAAAPGRDAGQWRHRAGRRRRWAGGARAQFDAHGTPARLTRARRRGR